jgi:hypothetical protein
VDEFNKFYARHPEVYQVVRALPQVVALLGTVPENADSVVGSLSRGSGQFSRASAKRSVGLAEDAPADKDDLSLDSLGSLGSTATGASVQVKRRLSDQEGDFHTPKESGGSIFSSVPSIIEGVPPVVVADLKSFYVPLAVGNTSLLENEDPWSPGDVMLRDGLRVIASKVLELAKLTAKACQHTDEATIKTARALSKLRARQHALRDDLESGYPRSATYEQHTSVWGAVIGLLDTVETHRFKLRDFDSQVRAFEASANDALARFTDLEGKLEAVETQTADILTNLSASLHADIAYLDSRIAALPSSVPVAAAAGSGLGFGSPLSRFAQQAEANRAAFGVSAQPSVVDNEGFAAKLAALDARLLASEQKNQALETELIALRSSGGQISAPRVSDGGVGLDRIWFSSVEAVKAFLSEHNMIPYRVAMFADAISFYAHSSDGYRTPKDASDTVKNMTRCGFADPPCQRAIFSFDHRYPAGFLSSDHTEVKDGEAFDMLKSRSLWNGTNGYDGTRDRFLQKTGVAHEVLEAYISQYSEMGPLQQLAMTMGHNVRNFMTGLFNFSHNDLEKLLQMNISEKECLLLVSDQWKIIFGQIYKKRMLMMSFSPLTEPMDYAANYLYHSLAAHEVMNDFLSKGFSGHGLLGNSFVRFLACHIGATSVTTIDKKVGGLESRVGSLETTVANSNKAINKRLEDFEKALKKKAGQGAG